MNNTSAAPAVTGGGHPQECHDQPQRRETPVDENKLAELAKHYAKTLLTDWVTESRMDAALIDPDERAEFTAVDVIEGHGALTEQIPTYEGQTIQVQNIVSIIDDDGYELLIPFDKVTAEHIDSAQVCLAAQFHALYTQAHSIMATFAGLDRLRQHLAEGGAK